MRWKIWAIAGAIGLVLLPGFSHTKPGASPHKTAANRLQGWVQVRAVGKDLDAASKVKGVFKKASRTVSLKCQLLNQGAKPLGALRGTLRFTSYFGDLIGDLSVEVVAPVAPGQSVTTTWKIKRERFSSDEAFKTFADTPLDKMRVTWIPSMVVLSDGTRLLP